MQRPLLFVLGPIAAAPVHLLLSPKREFAADRFAAELCESPHGLADALLRLELAGELVEFRANPATEPLYTINPFEPTGLAAMFGTHPPTEERVRRLRELDPEWREKLRAA
jgi:heat shock protein HtpX